MLNSTSSGHLVPIYGFSIQDEFESLCFTAALKVRHYIMTFLADLYHPSVDRSSKNLVQTNLKYDQSMEFISDFLQLICNILSSVVFLHLFGGQY